MSFPFLVSAALLLSASSCTAQQQGSGDVALGEQSTAPVAPTAAEPVRPELTEAEKKFYREMGEAAWRYLDANYQRSTGLVSGTPHWAYITLWDVGGQLLAFQAAKGIGVLPEDEYDRRMQRLLNTLERMPLSRNAAFAKVYSTKDASIGANRRPGWSATDLGRFLIALRVVAEREPKFAAQAERIARRNDFSQIVRGGYLYGQGTQRNGQPWSFQEGRIGYEQYVAQGFKLWGVDVANALDPRKNGEAVEVLGVPLLADRRYQDRLLSEPFILLGIELGFPENMRELATNMLRVQEARYRQTGQITIASEDAVSIAPHYFYYYCVFCNRKPFVIDLSSPGSERDEPRWVSTKGAFGWHALMPNDYTRKATEYVQAAFSSRKGWASGVFEGTRKSTDTYDINTAAVLLEIAYYQLRGGKPLIEAVD